MSEQKNKCFWCKKETNSPNTYHAMGPLLEEYELLIQDFEGKYGKEWYNYKKEIGKKSYEEVIYYDQIVNTVSKGIVCPKCLDEDDKLWRKYRNKK